ncbi:MAG: DUF6029 family protein [Bacteroidota bacterium]
MRNNTKLFLFAITCGILTSNHLIAQSIQNNFSNITLGEVHGNIQLDAQYYIPDSTIGAPKVPEKMLSNGFANINYTRGKFTAGIRYESYLNALQGFDARYQGNGLEYRFASYKSDALEVTIGNFYQQFGSGLVLRSYEERGLGFDNALDGFRLKYEPIKGVYLTGLTGKQRSFMTYGTGVVRGFDGEMQVNETFAKLSDKKLKVMIGGSFVSRFQSADNPSLVLPENVGASAGRFQLSRNNFNLNGEFASKINDPNATNNKIYRPGDAQLLTASYAMKGFAVSVSAERSDNMNFRSDRNATLNNLLLNYTPALNKNHTYSLLTFYPYASQPNGEFQSSEEVNWKAIKKSNYKLDITVNYSAANDLDTTHSLSVDEAHNFQGYKTKSYSFGKTTIFRDFYVEVNQKFGKKYKASLIYSYQEYNKGIIQEPGAPTIYSSIIVADLTYRMQGEKTVRVELQNLSTKQDKHDWAQAMVEYTYNTNWFGALLDQYNYGNEISKERYHYYSATIGYTKNANRITLSYGKQRQGIFCVGGICRQVPASNGITLSVTSSF